MIAVRLKGGLGNQLFQYAAARALADRLGRGVGFDVRELLRPEPGDTPRAYHLGALRVRAAVLPPWRLLLRGLPRSRRIRRLARLGTAGGLCLERGTGFQAWLEARARASSFAYLDGYWQSWRYFEDGRPALLEDLRPRSPAAGRNARLLRLMGGANSVCVHVRRGDYVSHPSAAAYHGLLGPGYYRQALRRLGTALRGARCYVFSDEPAWAARHLKLPVPRTVVGHNGAAPHEDLRLMAACRHFVVANSSFSWWGAWLGVDPRKRVVAPRRWALRGPDLPDLCPPAWARL